METQLTKFQIANNGKVKEEARKAANYFLNTYQWNAKQRDVLYEISMKGYIISTYNDVAKTFDWMDATNGDEKMIISINNRITEVKSRNPQKKSLSFYVF